MSGDAGGGVPGGVWCGDPDCWICDPEAIDKLYAEAARRRERERAEQQDGGADPGRDEDAETGAVS